MNLERETAVLLKKEIRLEWRQRYAISGILLYVLGTVFIVYVAFQQLSPQLWNVLFWIIMLFASVNAVAKSFVQESGTQQFYYYQLAHPLAVLFSKIIYNSILLMLIGGLTMGALSLVAGNPIQREWIFMLALVLGSLGFSIAFTFISAIAARTDNSATLMTILSFPLIIPMLLLLVNLSAHAIGLLEGSLIRDDAVLLIGIDLLLVGLAMVLFPFLWRD
ncbi:MAG: cytochrome C biogenesis protein CcmB [Saprospiraceae bacterium]|nr:MAG: cytochrome C biogenesis protein CcmB [Saprospiraceae bacterium]